MTTPAAPKRTGRLRLLLSFLMPGRGKKVLGIVLAVGAILAIIAVIQRLREERDEAEVRAAQARRRQERLEQAGLEQAAREAAADTAAAEAKLQEANTRLQERAATVKATIERIREGNLLPPTQVKALEDRLGV